jgi:hypothetical protein
MRGVSRNASETVNVRAGAAARGLPAPERGQGAAAEPMRRLAVLPRGVQQEW